MDKYPRYFMISSVVYLLTGTFIGTLMAFHLIGAKYRFIHVHINLYGFMAMMIFGVAYHILPRFLAKPVKWPTLIPLHFYAANLGLISMMAAYTGNGYFQPQSLSGILFAASGLFAFLGVIIFAINLLPVLMPTKRKPISVTADSAGTLSPSSAGTSGSEEATITGEMKIGEILNIKPGTLKVFIAAGFKGFENPETRKAFGEKLVLKTACQIRSVDVDELLIKLNGAIGSGEIGAGEIKTDADTAPPATPVSPAKPPSIKKGDMVKLKTPVGEMIQVYPETKKVLEDNYGGECFSCPGMAVETIEQTANMHGKDPEEILRQANAIVKEIIGKE